LPRIGLASKFGSIRADCWDYGDCGLGGGFTTRYYGGGVWYPMTPYTGTGVIVGGGAAQNTTTPTPTCNCFHGTAYMENGVCKCCEGVLINGSCTGGIKQPPTAICTADAKLCPDGSSVGRDPANNCEFAPCPNYQEPPALSITGWIKDHPHFSIAGGLVLAYILFGSKK
jgi:hypothetical protein